jgi:hypothetical protein
MNILENPINDTVDRLLYTYADRDGGVDVADIATVERWAKKALSDAALIGLVIEGKLEIIVDDGTPRFRVSRPIPIPIPIAVPSCPGRRTAPGILPALRDAHPSRGLAQAPTLPPTR